MVKNGTRKTALVGLTLVVLVGLIVVYVPVSSEKIDVQCVTAPCPAIIETKTIYDILTTMKQPEPIACTLEFAPVCGVDGNTYSNACHAGANNVEIAFTGECPVGSNTGEMLVTEPTSAFCRIYPTFEQCR